MSTVLHVFSPYGRRAASPRIRMLRWIELLGVNAEVHDYLGGLTAGVRDLLGHPVRALRAERELRAATGLACALVGREVSPLSSGALEARLLRTAALGVYDLDDGFPWDTAGGLRRVFPKPAKAARAASAADRVLVANGVLADWAAHLNPDVRVIPSCVEPSDYAPKSSYEVADRPIIGWIGSPWTLPYLRTIEAALLRIHDETGARLELVGPGSASLGALDEMADRLPWSEEAEASLPARWDVAIAPLSHGEFERARSSYKLLQYAAAGVPSIGSRFGATGEVVSSLGAHGADSDDEWFHAIHDVLGAPAEARAALGEGQRAAVERGYSYSAWADEWRRAISD